MKEIWKDVKGYENRYWVSNYGRIKSKKKVLKPTINHWGYAVVYLYNNKMKRNNYFIHRLVANAFINNPKPDKFNQINHKDCNKLNNYIDNLEWCTQSHNQIHAVLNKKRSQVKLTPQKVIEIREKYKTGNYTFTKLGKEYGVCRKSISNIIYKKRWKFI